MNISNINSFALKEKEINELKIYEINKNNEENVVVLKVPKFNVDLLASYSTVLFIKKEC